MTLQLVEGQEFSVDYSLLQRVSQRDGVQQWIALDTQLGERVLLKIFEAPLATGLRGEMTQAINATRGLVHPNIARVLALNNHDGIDFVVSRLVRSASPLQHQPLDRGWPVYEQLFSALAYAHSVGVAHGRLHPGNLLVDDRGVLHITDFALPAASGAEEDYQPFLSPQAQKGNRPDPSDDIFSLGQLLFVALTGKTAAAGSKNLETTRPVPAELKQLVLDMLSENHWERPTDLPEIKALVQAFALGEADAPIEPAGSFRRAAAAGTSVGVTPQTHRPARERQVMSAGAAYAGFALLMGVAVAVFFLLPDPELPTSAPPTSASATAPASTNPGGTAPVTTPPAPALTPLEQARQQQLEAEGQQVARELLRLQVKLEDTGVQIWGQQPYRTATDLAASADQAYRDSQFDLALQQYGEAKSQLEQLVADIPDILAENERLGDTAIEAGDATAAIRAFTIVTAIDPTDTDARQKLTRAENLEQLSALLAETEFLEGDGKLAAAQDKINEALALDGRWQPALAAKRRLADKVALQAFNAAMSEGLAALATEDFAAARAAFNRASSIRPGSAEPSDGLQQVEVAIAQRKIRELRAQAEAQETAADWSAAITTYETLLDLDPTLVFAAEGLERTRARAALEEELQRFLDQPTLLASDEELGAARRALAAAARIPSPPERTKQQISDLSVHISLARIKIPVEIQSDQRTDITVYRVGNLGALDRTTLELIPGRYTIVGKRRGYRDVEVELTLLGGRPPPPIQVSCTEKIQG
ncbi:MAG: hypothetical protein ACFHX7_22435 [Pseudomonadota bacterium]